MQSLGLKNFVKTKLKSQELKKWYRNVILSVFFDKTKITYFLWKNANFGWTPVVEHVIYTFFGFFLGELELCQL